MLAKRRCGYLVVDLDELRGRTNGVLRLPLWLDWSPFRLRYDVSEPQSCREMYEVVLCEARSEEDLAEFLDGGVLVEVWSSLQLPAFLRDAWEQQHPSLRGVVDSVVQS